MSAVDDLVQRIYKLSDSYKFQELGPAIETAFSQWISENKWSEINSVLFSLDMKIIRKKTAELILSHLYDHKDKVILYKQFYSFAMKEFNSQDIKQYK